MKFADLMVGDLFKLSSSFPTGMEPTYMKVGGVATSMDNVVCYEGLMRGQLMWFGFDTSVEVVEFAT